MVLVSKWESIINRNKVLKGFAYVICAKKYQKEVKLNAIRGISNIAIRKSKDSLNVLLKIPNIKFLDSFSELLSERNVNF